MPIIRPIGFAHIPIVVNAVISVSNSWKESAADLMLATGDPKEPCHKKKETSFPCFRRAPS